MKNQTTKTCFIFKIGAIQDRYIRGVNLIASDKNGYYAFNAHGDVTQLTSASGEVAKNYQYDAFGVEENLDDADVNPFRYCGEYTDLETNTIYLRNRYYNPSNGRFSAEDPIKAGLNYYTYASVIIGLSQKSLHLKGFMCLVLLYYAPNIARFLPKLVLEFKMPV